MALSPPLFTASSLSATPTSLFTYPHLSFTYPCPLQLSHLLLPSMVVMLSKGAFAGHIRPNSVPILIQAGSDELEMTDDHNDIEDEANDDGDADGQGGVRPYW